MDTFSNQTHFTPAIKVIGAGGGGQNVVTRLIHSGLSGVELISANTDQQALEAGYAHQKILLGPSITGGRGAGANPNVGWESARESRQLVAQAVQGAEMVFVAAGLGGGTGTGAAPVIAQEARQAGALTVGMVTLPFSFEGKRRMATAMQGLEALRRESDVMLVILNDRLIQLAPPKMSMIKAFEMADSVLVDAIQGISDLITLPGLINVDFADVRTILENKGGALMSKGVGRGPDRLVEAARQAVQNPLLGQADIRGAKGVLAHVMGNEDLSLAEVNQVMERLQQEAGDEANLIFGATTSPAMGEEVSLMLLVTGLDSHQQAATGWMVNR